MLRPIDEWFMQQKEPCKSYLQFLRDHILKLDSNISEKWSYSMPFYHYRDKRFCYLWVHKKLLQPYIGIVDGKLVNGPDLLAEKRSRMKILLLDPGKDIPLKRINQLLKEVIALYK